MHSRDSTIHSGEMWIHAEGAIMRYGWAVGLLLVVMASSHAVAAPPAVPLMAGVAKVEITAPMTLPKNDPLYVKALVLKKGPTTAVIITLDAVAVGEIGPVPNTYLPAVRKSLKDDLGIPESNIIVNASHCHGIVRADVDRSTVEAVKAALARMVPVTVAVGVGLESRISENRRLRLKSGKEADARHAYSLPADDDVVNPGPIDPQVGVVRLDTLEGKTLAVLYHFACHPIMGVPNGGNTADLVGYASKVIESTMSEGTIALFLQGCGGDINPMRYKDIHQPRHAEPLGTMLGLTVVQTARSLKAQPNAELAIHRELLALPRADHADRIARLEAEQTRLVKSLKGTSLNLRGFLELEGQYRRSAEAPLYFSHLYQTEKALGRSDLTATDETNRKNLQAYVDNILTMEEITRVQTNIALLKRHQATNLAAGRKPLPADLMGLRLGEVVLVTFPGELTVELGLQVKKVSPHQRTFVSGYSNGYLYYTPTARQLKNPGAAQEDCDTLVAPEWETIFHERVLAMLKSL